MNKALLKLHISVLLAGATGLFGRLVSLQELPLVWYRLMLTVVMLIPILYFQHKLQKLEWKKVMQIAGAGMFLGVHWVLFYASIKASNVSIGVVCCALIGFYTAFLDPIINHHKFYLKDIFFSMLTLAGLLLIFHFDTRYRLGIAIGAVSSLLAALFSIYSKKVTSKYPELPTSTFVNYEMIGGLMIISIALPFYMNLYPENSIVPCTTDWIYLIILALVCTIGQYLLQIGALKKVSTFTMNLSYNLEPVYSIILAMILFGESQELNFSFYVGLALIVCSVVVQNVIASRPSKSPLKGDFKD